MCVRIQAMYTLWREWLFSFGSLILCVIFAFIIPKTILPAVVLLLAWILNSNVAPLRANRLLACVRVTSLTSRVLFISALIMLACLLVNYTDWFSSIFPPETLNREIPYIVVLIVFPVATVVMALGWLTHGSSRHCLNCKMMHGLAPEESFATNHVHREALLQLKMLFWISLFISIFSWAYYLLYYSNANYNGADNYVFLIAPTLLFVVSLFYIGARYRAIIDTLKEVAHSHQNDISVMRFLILHDDRLLLETVTQADQFEHSRVDTPAEISMPFAAHYPDSFACDKFMEISGLQADMFTLRPLYCNLTPDGHNNIYHYAVVLDGDKPIPDGFKLTGVWSTLEEIDRLWKYNTITKALAAELTRIFTITMAWKTYDEQGFRRYAVPNYRPSFRLRDFTKWDVDYNDPTWIAVALDNQDRFMFYVRRLLRKISRKV